MDKTVSFPGRLLAWAQGEWGGLRHCLSTGDSHLSNARPTQKQQRKSQENLREQRPQFHPVIPRDLKAIRLRRPQKPQEGEGLQRRPSNSNEGRQYGRKTSQPPAKSAFR